MRLWNSGVCRAADFAAKFQRPGRPDRRLDHVIKLVPLPVLPELPYGVVGDAVTIFLGELQARTMEANSPQRKGDG